jgi:phosphoserine phosphatase
MLKAMSNDSIVVSDFDDTLFMSGAAVAAASEDIMGKPLSRAQVRSLGHGLKEAIYEAAKRRYNHLFVPNMKAIEYVQACEKRGMPVVILSAGSSAQVGEVSALLKKYNVPYDKLVMREDMSGRDEDWKKEKLGELTVGYSTVILLEDKKENLDLMATALEGKDVRCYLASESGLFSYP